MLKPLSKKIIFWVSLIVILTVVAASYFIISSRQPAVEYSTVKVRKGDLGQTVSVTGSVKPSAEIDLMFKSSGQIKEINVTEGDKVKKDDVLASLDDEEQQIRIKQAEASLAVSQANLSQRLAGASEEDINVSTKNVDQSVANLEKAQSDLKNARTDYENTQILNEQDIKNAQLSLEAARIRMQSAQTSLNNTQKTSDQSIGDAYQNALTQMDSSLAVLAVAISDMDNILGIDDAEGNEVFENYLGLKNTQSISDAEMAYRQASSDYKQANLALSYLDRTSETAVEGAIADVKKALNSASTSLAAVDTMLQYSTTGVGYTLADLNNHKITINADRSSVSSSLSSLESREQALGSARLSDNTSYDSALSAYESAQKEYEQAQQQLEQTKALSQSKLSTAQALIDSAEKQVKILEASLGSSEAALELKKASPRSVDIAALQAQVRIQQASLQQARQQLEDLQIKAPMDGIITQVNFEVGEQATITSDFKTAAFRMQAEDHLEVEADVPETDIAKVNLDDEVNITLDAMPDMEFKGQIIFIDPAETNINGVVYYKVKADFSPLENMTSYNIKPGMTASLTISTEIKKDVFLIPSRAINRSNGTKTVKILKSDNSVVEREVETGVFGDDGLVEITYGLDEGEEVITFSKELE